MEAWIRNTFQVLGPSESPDGVESFRFTSGQSIVIAPLGWFTETFGSVSTPPKATALKAVDSGDSLGWHRHFDAWVEQGIIAAE